MDSAVAVVQAYLRLNGYFTVTEYPVFEADRGGAIGAATDLDVLAFRFPGAGRPVVGASPRAFSFAPDPALACPADQADMLIGEVKEGKAELNAAARDGDVLRAVLARFGCCAPEDAPRIAGELLRRAAADSGRGHRIRLVAFGSRIDDARKPRYHRLSLGHVVRFLRGCLNEHWAVYRHGQFKDPAFGFLSTIEKALRGDADRDRVAVAGGLR